jgi:hypothetical protein
MVVGETRQRSRDAVLADRSVDWLGSERDKRRYFEERLRDHLRDNEYPRLVFGEPPDVTIRYFPDKLPIGYEPDRRRHVFLYLARSPSPMDFRVFILRHTCNRGGAAKSQGPGAVATELRTVDAKPHLHRED